MKKDDKIIIVSVRFEQGIFAKMGGFKKIA